LPRAALEASAALLRATICGKLVRIYPPMALEALKPLVDLTLSLFFGDTVPFLNAPGQLISLALGTVEIVIRKITPLLFGLALKLGPFSLDLIPVHFSLSISWVADTH
jgi:hypothetical protein